MAVVAEELISDLIVRDGKLRSGIRSAQQAYGAGIGSMRNDTKRFESEFNRSSSNVSDGFKRMAGTLAAGISLAATSQLIDSYTRLQNSLRVAGLEGEKLQSVQNDLLALSTRYGVNIEGLANLYGKAADAGRSFGASEAEVLKLTEATSQSLLITGTRAEQASGAILGLSQALASGTVRAEEFNQINEGGLRPLLQAAAATERFGGDVNKLRAAVLDGKLSSQEFFNAIMAGSAQLEGQASKATLTLSGAFEALNSALTVYVGGAASASGVTGALAAGIGALADNLDTIIPALATIVGIIGVRYVASLTAAAAASLALRASSAGLTLSLNGVATAATLASRGFLAAFGGPVGAAVIALGAGLAYLAAQSAEAEARLAGLNAEVAAAEAEADRLEAALRKAGVGVDAIEAASGAAKGTVDALSDSFLRASREAHRLGDESVAAALKIAQANLVKSQIRQAELREEVGSASSARGASVSRFGYLPGQNKDLQNAETELAGEMRKEAAFRRQSLALVEAGRNGVDVSAESAVRPLGGTTDKPDTKKTRKGKDLVEEAARQAFQNAQELRSLQIEELRAKEDLATTADERARFQRAGLELERATRLAELDEAVRRKDLTAEEAKARRAIIENLYGAGDEIKVQSRESAYEEQITREQKRDAERDRADLAQTELDIRRDELQFQLDMADTQVERRRIALAILEAETATQRAALEGVKATEAVNSAKWRQADADLRALDSRAGRDAQRIGRDTENPLERLSRESNLTADQMNEAFQSIQADGLTALSDGITYVIMQTRSLGDVFKSVANQIIADLIRIAVQKAVVGALGNALGGLFGGGGLTGTSGGMDLRGFRAGGGPVRAGQLYRVNEGQQEFFRPATDGRVVPLSQAQAARPAGGASAGPTIVQLAVAPGEMFVPIVEGISGNVAVRTVQATAPGIVRAATIETNRRAVRPRT